jgi:hypothetical protein
MKAVNYIAKAAVVAVLAFGLGACGKKNNGSAAAPAGSCTYNGYTYIDATTGAQCSPTATQNICPANGITVTYINGQVVQQPCTPGQYVSVYPTNPNYPWNNVPTTGAGTCQQYTMQYGVPYVPMVLQGQFVCVRYDLIQQQSNYNPYYFGDYYDYGYDYYYAYPPYSGSGCGTSIDFGGSWGSIGICF